MFNILFISMKLFCFQLQLFHTIRAPASVTWQPTVASFCYRSVQRYACTRTEIALSTVCFCNKWCNALIIIVLSCCGLMVSAASVSRGRGKPWLRTLYYVLGQGTWLLYCKSASLHPSGENFMLWGWVCCDGPGSHRARSILLVISHTLQKPEISIGLIGYLALIWTLPYFAITKGCLDWGLGGKLKSGNLCTFSSELVNHFPNCLGRNNGNGSD